jgi:hypothetical protein
MIRIYEYAYNTINAVPCIIIIIIHQWPRSEIGSLCIYLTTGAEIISGEHSGTRIKPLSLANGNGHSRHMAVTVTPEGKKFPLDNGRCVTGIICIEQ